MNVAGTRTAARIATLRVMRLASGPGTVGAALSIVRNDDGRVLLEPAGRLRLEARPRPDPLPASAAGTRIGVAFAGAWAERPWRFWVVDTTAVRGSRGR